MGKSRITYESHEAVFIEFTGFYNFNCILLIILIGKRTFKFLPRFNCRTYYILQFERNSFVWKSCNKIYVFKKNRILKNLIKLRQ